MQLSARDSKRRRESAAADAVVDTNVKQYLTNMINELTSYFNLLPQTCAFGCNFYYPCLYFIEMFVSCNYTVCTKVNC